MTFALLLACFFLSGLSALLYETAWTREFAFVFGTSELAVVAVLAAYMAGLALGAALAARLAPRIRRPVLVYGVLELGIACWALAVPFAIRGIRGIYLGWLGGLHALPETLGAATHAFHLLSAFLILVPCTALMGATLPLLARHAVTRDSQIGPRVGLLYAVNTFGAIAGTLIAAFVLLPALGLRQTVYVGAGINALVFLTAALLARRTQSAVPQAAPRARGVPWILPAIAVSGAVSFGYELLWFRMLGQLLGGSTAAFSTMLASFLAGIALGSAVASRMARTQAAAATGFFAAQLASALVAWLGFRAADQLPELARSLGASVNALAPGALLATALLLPLTLCIGASFPFAVRLLARDAGEAAASSARVYAWNTVGSIGGAVGTGYALLPWLGLEGTLVAAALTNLALAALASLRARPPRRALAGVAAAGALLLALAPTPRPDTLLRSSPLGGGYSGPLRYLAVGRSATVALIEVEAGWRLTTNGLPESLIARRGFPSGPAAARWFAILPVLARPEIDSMLIVGLGGGLTLSAVPRAVDAIDVIELEPEVVAANRAVPDRERGDGRNPLDDPRLSLRLGDARGALILANRRYDAIVSQPSHPWASGASHLYTREFFELVRSRLTPRGVFLQWIGVTFADADRLRAVIASMTDVFEHVEVYRLAGDAIVMLCSDAAFDITATAARAIAAAPEDFAVDAIYGAEDVLAQLVLDSQGSRAISAGTRPITDDFNLLAMSRVPETGPAAHWLLPLLRDHEPLPELADTVDLALLARRLHSLAHAGRARRLAHTLEPARRELILGWLAIDSGKPAAARQHLRAALAADPAQQAARTALAFVDGVTNAELPERVRAVIEARGAGANWQRVRSLDARLASWGPGELLFPEAAELRARWRVQIGDASEIADALEPLDILLRRNRLPRHLLLRARVAERLGDRDLAWSTLAALGEVLEYQPAPEIRRRATALARRIGAAPRDGRAQPSRR